jgi:ABC-2 type transport system permease protein
VRGSLLKGQDLGDQWRELSALVAFVLVVTALAMARYRRTLD